MTIGIEITEGEAAVVVWVGMIVTDMRETGIVVTEVGAGV